VILALVPKAEETMSALEELIKALPPELEQEVEDFARFVLARPSREHESELRQDVVGVLRDLHEQYTSAKPDESLGGRPDQAEIAREHKTLPELVQSLPSDAQQEVRDYIEFLLEKRRRKMRGQPKFEWAGALKDLRDQYTSVDLQHEISSGKI